MGEKRGKRDRKKEERRETGRGESRADVSISFEPPFDRKVRRGQNYDSEQLHSRTSISFVHTHTRTRRRACAHTSAYIDRDHLRESTFIYIYIYIYICIHKYKYKYISIHVIRTGAHVHTMFQRIEQYDLYYRV